MMGDTYERNMQSLAARLVLLLIFVLLFVSCGGSSTYVPPEDIAVSDELVDLEIVVDVARFDVYKFTDDDVVCYVAIRDLNTSIDCLD